jgi:hypothetical protein
MLIIPVLCLDSQHATLRITITIDKCMDIFDKMYIYLIT